MKNKVLNFIRKNNLITPKDKVLVALSGGPDSICLLDILLELKEILDIDIAVAHVNHLLRGQESDSDENFTKKLCEKINVKYYCKRVDINKISKEKNISHELAGREERYSFFSEICKNYGYNKIAIAHNLNDNAETVLMRLMRGTGLDGLIGIKSKRDNIIRPIMCLNRKEIESYINKKELQTCLDKSNLERDYTRNKIRLDLIPYMQENFNKDLINSINRMSKILDIDNDYIEQEVQKKFNIYVYEQREKSIIKKELFKEHRAIVFRVIRKSIMRVAKTAVNFENKHIEEVFKLASYDTGKKINLPNYIIAENIYGDIAIKNTELSQMEFGDHISIKKQDINNKEIQFNDYSIKFEKILDKNNKQISNNDLIKYFDYDNIKEYINIRTRKNGDRFKPLGMNGSKKLKDIYIDLKIPREDRDLIPLICFDDEISWIVGYKVSEVSKITKSTKQILKITIRKEQEND